MHPVKSTGRKSEKSQRPATAICFAGWQQAIPKEPVDLTIAV